MANPEHLKILKRGVKAWNKWREDNPEVIPDLTGANLIDANLTDADLIRADLIDADLRGASLIGADLISADLRGASLIGADLKRADLTDADLSQSILFDTIFSHTILNSTKFNFARLYDTILIHTDLSEAGGLETVKHRGPSEIGINTLYLSQGKIPESFLRGCGIPDDFIAFIPSHFGIQQAIQFYSCFISYSTKDEEFARRLYSRMRDEHLRVWFAPEDIKGGEKLHEQIERAIQVHDRLLIVLSENSMQSEWVMTEIRRARKTEIEENRRKLFPIRLVDFDTLRQWKCFDADSGKDLAREVREYYIPDFSNWKEHDSFEEGFAKLLRDLKAEEKR